MSITPVDLNKENNDANVLPDDNEVDPNYMLSELYCRVFLYNTKEARKLARKGG
jgi:hypothetical protein